MRSKVLILVAALLLGAIAAVTAVLYVGTARRGAESQAQAVEVLVAKQDVARGTALKDMLSAGAIVKQLVPQQYVAAGALSATRTLDGLVLAAPISKGEQLTQARFQQPLAAGLAYAVPKGFMAVSIPYSETRGVGGMVKPGDNVAVLLTMNTPANNQTATRILISKGKVLAVGRDVGDVTSAQTAQVSNNTIAGGQTQQRSTVGATVTLALSPSDTEKLVFAQENGKIWLSLLSANESGLPPVDAGQTIDTLYSK